MSATGFIPTAGEKCRTVIFHHEGDDDYNPLPDVTDALQRLCRPYGLKPHDIHCVSSEPWTEPIGDLQPVEGMTLHTYEATAIPETWT